MTLDLTEEAIQTLQQQREVLLNATSEGIHWIDTSGVIIFENPAAARMLGWEPGELIGGAVHDIVHRTSLSGRRDSEGECRICAGFRDGEVHRGTTELFWRKDGTCFPVEYTSSPARNEAGEITGVVVVFADVTERRRAEAELRESEERFRRSFEQAAVGMAHLSTEGHFRWVNEKLCALLGYSREELLTQNFLDLILSEDLADAREALSAWQAGEQTSHPVETRYHRKDGEVVWIKLLTSLERAAPREPGYLSAIFVEITARKTAERALRETDEKFRLLADNITDAFWIRSADLRELHYISPGFERIWGRPRESLQANPHQWIDFIVPEDRDRVRNAFLALVQEGPSLDIEYSILRPGGERRSIRARGFQVRDRAGTVIRLTGIVTDVTERKLAEAARERLATIVEATSDLVSISDPAGKLVYLNPAGRKLLGVDGQDDLTNTALADFLPDTANHPIIAEGFPTAARLGVWSGETVLLSRRGQEIPVSQVVLAHKGANEEIECFSIVMRDISERKQREEAQLARQIAERANRAKSEFLSRMSHELRTPMNAILGFAEVLGQEEGLTGDQRESVEHIVKGGSHLLALINELLAVSSVEPGSPALASETVALPGLLQETIGLLEPLSLEFKVRVVVLSTETADGHVRADRQRLKQVLLSLLGNAIKYNRPGGSVIVRYQTIGGLPAITRISVTDTGAGLSVEKLAQLFQPFERLGAEQTQVKGTGLGLVVAKRMVEQMGGVLRAESVVGVGSTFWVELPSGEPLVQAASEPADDRVSDVVPEHPAERRVLLYIDDNPARVRLVARILARRPAIQLLSAETAGRGLEMAREVRPDVIMLDLPLIDRDADEVLTRLAAEPHIAAIPMIILTAGATPERYGATLSSGARVFLTKPIDVRGFLNAIDQLLQRQL